MLDLSGIRVRIRRRQDYLREARDSRAVATGVIASALTSTKQPQRMLREPRPLYVDSSLVWLGGVEQAPNAPITRVYDDLRADVLANCPFPVDRVAIRKELLGMSGVLDCSGIYLLFKWVTDGQLVVRLPSSNYDGGCLFDKLTQEEVDATLEYTRKYNKILDPNGELVEFVPLNLYKGGDKHHVGYTRIDPRTGKREFVKPLGYTPQKPSIVVKPKRGGVLRDNGPQNLEKDDEIGLAAYRFCKKKNPRDLQKLQAAVSGYVDASYDITDHKTRKNLITDLVDHLMSTGVYTVSGNADGGESDEGGESEETGWTTRYAKTTPRLPKAYEPKGYKLGVNGKARSVSPDIEHAVYTYAKRFLVKQGTMAAHDKFVRGFETSLAKMLGVKDARFDYTDFVRNIQKEDVVVKKKKSKKEAETPETHPHLYVDEDGVPTRLLSATLPMGSFYTGKGKYYGAWVPPVKESDITLNLSAKPKSWVGGHTVNSDEDWYMSWVHPITGKKGYAYLSRKEADIRKFYNAAFLGTKLQKIMDDVERDIKNGSSKQAATALCVLLIDRLHFRNGNETFATLKEGTFGVASLLKKHVKISGSSVTFSFVGKKQEEWTRSLDFSGLPQALNLLKKQIIGGPNDKLWETDSWRVTSQDVNAYLAAYDNVNEGMHVTAKTFRTFHANRYMYELLQKLKAIKQTYRLTDKDVRKIYKGVKSSDSLVNRKVGGVSLKDALGLTPYKKARGAVTYGLLPTVAARLGHTTGACRSNYLDPSMLTEFAIEHGWDERTPKEQRSRDDLPILEKSTTSRLVDASLVLMGELDA